MNRNLLATVLIIIAVGIYFTVTEQAWADVQAAKATNDKYSQAIDSASKLIAVRDQVLNDYNNLSQDDRDRLAKMLPNTTDNIRMIIDMNNLAVQHGFVLTGLAVSGAPAPKPGQTPKPALTLPPVGGTAPVMNVPTIAQPTVETVTISFGMSASYEKFQSFMKDLEANLRIMDINHLTVTANDTGNYDWSVSMTTYWLRQP